MAMVLYSTRSTQTQRLLDFNESAKTEEVFWILVDHSMWLSLILPCQQQARLPCASGRNIIWNRSLATVQTQTMTNKGHATCCRVCCQGAKSTGLFHPGCPFSLIGQNFPDLPISPSTSLSLSLFLCLSLPSADIKTQEI